MLEPFPKHTRGGEREKVQMEAQSSIVLELSLQEAGKKISLHPQQKGFCFPGKKERQLTFTSNKGLPKCFTVSSNILKTLVHRHYYFHFTGLK